MSAKTKNNLLKHGIYNLAGGVVRIGAGIAVIPILIRSLGLEEYGLWTLASSILGVVLLAEGGLSTATTVFVSQDLTKKDNSLSETITVSLVAMFVLAGLAVLVLYLCSGFVTSWYPALSNFQSITLFHSLQVGAFVVWCKLFQQVFIGIEQAYQRYDLINIIGTISSILTSLGMAVVVLSSGKTLQIMQYQLLVSALLLLIHFYLVSQLVKGAGIKFQLTLSKALEIGKYSLMMWITSIGGVLFTRVDRLVIGSILGSAYLGVYSTITDIASQINSISAMAVQPMISSLSNEPDIKSTSTQRKVNRYLLANLYISLVLGLVLITFSPLILSVLLKQNIVDINHNYTVAFRLGVLIYSLYSVNSSSYYVLLGTKQVGKCSTISLFVGSVSLILIYFGAVNFGLVGAILGNAGFLGIYAFTFASMTSVGIPFNEYFRDLMYPVLGMISTSAILVFGSLNISISILLSSVFLVTISFWVKTKIDKLSLKSDSQTL
jgi:O-antigen/teichoic acid export membrane protein